MPFLSTSQWDDNPFPQRASCLDKLASQAGASLPYLTSSPSYQYSLHLRKKLPAFEFLSRGTQIRQVSLSFYNHRISSNDILHWSLVCNIYKIRAALTQTVWVGEDDMWRPEPCFFGVFSLLPTSQHLLKTPISCHSSTEHCLPAPGGDDNE